MNGNDNITVLKGVGDKSASLFLKCNISTVDDLLMDFPRAYEEFGDVTPIGSLKEGEKAIIRARVHSRLAIKVYRNLKVCTLRVKDESGFIDLCWYNMTFLQNVFYVNQEYIFIGELRKRNNTLTILMPKYYTMKQFEELRNSIQPIYPLTEGLKNNLVRKAIKQVKPYAETISDYLDADYRDKNELMNYADALWQIHFPENKEQIIKARRRIVYHEFFKFFLYLEALKSRNVEYANTHIINDSDKVHKFITDLPYNLTGAQLRCYGEIITDMGSERVMNRLVQGDVGSGKTMVAMLSMLATVLSGYQAAMMAPTDVLARQHYENFKKTLEPYGVKVVLLTGGIKGKEKKAILEQIKEHEADIIIGTHAVISDNVIYNNLGLVVTDEQHRFGVNQRESFSKKGDHPHVLVMSATPIPRTLAMMIFADMSISVIDELPSNRIPVKTAVVGRDKRSATYKAIEKELSEGHQCYIICPMVEENPDSDLENVKDYASRLELVFTNRKIGILHGKMKEQEKDSVLTSFSEGDIDILVSTTVVEVGIDVPNATFILIENAERYGLAQLHQLRGRVGRGAYQSYAVLMYGKFSDSIEERLGVLHDSLDGFFIARKDLELRGPGDFFGIRQSGELNFKMADMYQDADVLKLAFNEAKRWKKEGVDVESFKELALNENMEVSI